MLNSDLLKARLSQYGVVWMLAFVLPLIIGLAAPTFFHVSLIAAADMMLPVIFLVLALVLAGAIIHALLSRASGLIKLVIVLLTLVLALPLLWAPVLAVVLDAYVQHVSIEYSSAYAGFRILIAKLLYPISEFAFGGAVDTVWKGFQALSTIVGFFVGLHQLWVILRNAFSGPRQRDADITALSLD
jgi:hypothetical protein